MASETPLTLKQWHNLYGDLDLTEYIDKYVDGDTITKEEYLSKYGDSPLSDEQMKDLDTLYKKSKKYKVTNPDVIKNTDKSTQKINLKKGASRNDVFSKINKLYNGVKAGAQQIAESPAGKTVGKILKNPATKAGAEAGAKAGLGKLAGAVGMPLLWLGAGESLYDAGRATKDLIDAKVNEARVNRSLQDSGLTPEAEAMLAEGRRMDGSAIDPELRQLEQQYAQSEADLVAEQQALDQAKANYDMAVANASNNGGGIVPPRDAVPTTGDGGEQPQQQPTVQISGGPAVPNADVVGDEVVDANQPTMLEGGVTEEQPAVSSPYAYIDNFNRAMTDRVLNPEQTAGYISPQQALDALNTLQAQSQIMGNPYYRGSVVDAQNPYTFDQNVYNQLLAKDLAWGRGVGNGQSWSDAYLGARRNIYQGELGNQTGVPYEDYVKGVDLQRAEQQAQQVARRDAIMKALEQQKNAQKEALTYLANVEKSHGDLQKAYLTGNMDYAKELMSQGLQTDRALAVQDKENAGRMAELIKKEADPNRRMQAMGSYMASVAFLEPQERASYVALLPDEVFTSVGMTKKSFLETINGLFPAGRSGMTNAQKMGIMNFLKLGQQPTED